MTTERPLYAEYLPLEEFLAASLNDLEFFELTSTKVNKNFFIEFSPLEDAKPYLWNIYTVVKKFYHAHKHTLPTPALLTDLILATPAATKALEERQIDAKTYIPQLFKTPYNREYLISWYGDMLARQLLVEVADKTTALYNDCLTNKITYTESLSQLLRITDEAVTRRVSATSLSKEHMTSESAYLATELSEAESMIPTGFPVLDDSIGGGLRATGDLGLYVAPTGKGKTAIMLASANAIRWLGYNVLFISLETVAPELNTRLRAMETGLKIKDIVAGGGVKTYKKEFQDAYHALRRVTDANIYVADFANDRTSFDCAKLKETLLNYKRQYGVAVAFLDYIDIMNTAEWEREPEYSKLMKLYTKVREISLATGVPLWSASQVDALGFDTPIIKITNLQGSKGKANAIEKIITVNRNTFDVELPPTWKYKHVVTGQALATGPSTADIDSLVLSAEPAATGEVTQQDLAIATDPEQNIYEHIRLFVAKCRGAQDSALIKVEADFSRMTFRELGRENIHDYINRYNSVMGNIQTEERNNRGGHNQRGNNGGRV